MWIQYVEAVARHTDYQQLPDGRWRGTFNGALSASAEGETPEDVSFRIMRVLDQRVADWIVTKPVRLEAPAEPVTFGPEERWRTPPRCDATCAAATGGGGRKSNPSTGAGDR